MIQDRIERVPGVASFNFFGGTEREMRVVVDAERMARYGLTVGEVVGALRQANIALSAGDVDEGKRRYVVRTDGEFDDLSAVRQVPAAQQCRHGKPARSAGSRWTTSRWWNSPTRSRAPGSATWESRRLR